MKATKDMVESKSDTFDENWKIADDLRGAVDGWDFKQYVLGAIFYRFLSENLSRVLDDASKKYAARDDAEAEKARGGIIRKFGYFIKPSELFINLLTRVSLGRATQYGGVVDKEKIRQEVEKVDETLKNAFDNVVGSTYGAKSEELYRDLFSDFDVANSRLGSSKKARSEKLVEILEKVAEMKLKFDADDDPDAARYGDAFEDLLARYASGAGKSGGEFFTPSCVSRLLVKLGAVGRTRVRSVYDIACGSGSLLLKSLGEFGRAAAPEFYGQEINKTNYNFCRINMLLHEVDYTRVKIYNDDTLVRPKGPDADPANFYGLRERFDLVVSNPPYSQKWEGNGNPVLEGDERYKPAGKLAPNANSDLAFVMHALYTLNSSGTAAIVCFPGIFYRGGAERTIRKYLVDNNFVDAVILLPSNLFFGTQIVTCVFVLKKGRESDARVLFVDASSEFEKKIANSNALSDANIERIVGEYASRAEEPYFARLASRDEIAQADYNLAVSAYVESRDARERVDIVGLNREIDEIVERQSELRERIAEIVADLQQE